MSPLTPKIMCSLLVTRVGVDNTHDKNILWIHTDAKLEAVEPVKLARPK